ncbi:MAG: NADH-quinone oxidoreductase subunit NuoF [Deltaproteobacteria bacterium]|nr:NADH-quinone oxidoreductase subunit NuoF [Deltaproteobacteria bacterium]
MEIWRSHVLVCAGAGCVSSGCREVRDALVQGVKEFGLHGEVKVIETGCIGSCDLGPIIVVYPEGVFYQNVKAEDARLIAEEHLLKGRVVERLLYTEPATTKLIPTFKEIDFFKLQEKVVLRNCGMIDPMNIEEYIAREGYEGLAQALTRMSPPEVVDAVLRSGLRGRGGAGFPTGMKWRFTKQAEGNPKYVVCNADEGDPGAFMDRSVLEGDPHSVIEAMAIAGYAIGSSQGYVYVRAEYPLAIERLSYAIEQARQYKFLGRKIFETSFDFDLEIRIGAGAFVCGEETALMTSIEGKRGEPRPRPPFPAVAGLWNKPTLLNNVETYASIPPIITKGAEWYSQFGTAKSRGTKVFALAGDINNAGLVEIPMGTSLGKLIYDVGGGIRGGKKFKAAQIGGPSGGCIPREHLNVSLDYESVKDVGAIMGSGGLIVMDENTCMVDLARFFMDFIQDESCGKCPPCRIGSKRMLEILLRITKGEGQQGDIEQLTELGERIQESALCGLGQTAPNPVLSTLRFFRDEYEEHIKNKHCRAGVCQAIFAAPCQNACPADNNAWGYVTLISEGKFKEAIAVIKERNPFPQTMGRICFHPCEAKCRREQVESPVAICALKRFAADYDVESTNPYVPEVGLKRSEKVAIVGAGPAGLTAAYFLALKGYPTTVFEALPVTGGMMAVGIPEYRLPRRVLQDEVDAILKLGVELRLNSPVADVKTIKEQGYKAVFLATGAHKGLKLGIAGERLKGVLDGVSFLKNVNLGKPVKVGERVAVIGGGNVAIDAARTALRLGAKEVQIFYRRLREDMPGADWEITEAEKEGVKIHYLVAPVQMWGGNGGTVKRMECRRMVLGDFDRSGRKRPVPIAGSEFEVDVDTVIAAIGQVPDTECFRSNGFRFDSSGAFLVDAENLATGTPGVFAGGDNVRGPASAVEAIADGQKAATAIDKYLGGDGLLPNAYRDRLLAMKVSYDEEVYAEEHERIPVPHIPLTDRYHNFREVETGFTARLAVEEAKRCLHCYRQE